MTTNSSWCAIHGFRSLPKTDICCNWQITGTTQKLLSFYRQPPPIFSVKWMSGDVKVKNVEKTEVFATWLHYHNIMKSISNSCTLVSTNILFSIYKIRQTVMMRQIRAWEFCNSVKMVSPCSNLPVASLFGHHKSPTSCSNEF